VTHKLPLGKVTNDPEATMVYAKYESDIVDRYQVVLEGWPLPMFESPSRIGTMKELDRLVEALEGSDDAAPTCRFRELSDDEYTTHQADRAAKADQGEIEEWPRKQRSDKGVPRGPYKHRKNVNELGGEPSGRVGEKRKKGKENEGSRKKKKVAGKETEGSQKQKKKTGKAGKAKSREVVVSDNDES
jgi:hypothetical protein